LKNDAIVDDRVAVKACSTNPGGDATGTQFCPGMGDVTVLTPGDRDYDDEDNEELSEPSALEDRCHDKSGEIDVTSKPDPHYKDPTT
jgi:hypothetical protein